MTDKVVNYRSTCLISNLGKINEKVMKKETIIHK